MGGRLFTSSKQPAAVSNTAETRQEMILKNINPGEFFNMQMDLFSSYLLVDCRSIEEYQTSHIDLSVSVQELGGTAQTVENVILYSAEGLNDFLAKQAVNDIANNNSIKRRTPFVYIVEGGFSAYQALYPYMCTGHPLHAEGRLYPAVITSRVFLSNYGVASNHDVINILKITHIVNCTVDCPFVCSSLLESPIRTLRVPVIDDRDQNIQQYFEEAIAFIEDALNSNIENKVLIHCKHGQSRSATIAAAWLMAAGGVPQHSDALAYLKKCRSMVRPNEGFQKQLKLFGDNFANRK